MAKDLREEIYIPGPSENDGQDISIPAPQTSKVNPALSIIQRALANIAKRRRSAAPDMSQPEESKPIPNASQTFDLPDTDTKNTNYDPFDKLPGQEALDAKTDRSIHSIGVVGRVLEKLLAGGSTGTLGASESIFRTPEAIGRITEAGLEGLGIKPEQSRPYNILNPKTGILTRGATVGGMKFAGMSDVADQISAAQAMLPELHRAFRWNQEDSQNLDKGTKEIVDYVRSKGRTKRPGKLMQSLYSPTAWIQDQGVDLGAAVAEAVSKGKGEALIDVIKDPSAWAGTIGNAAPSLLLAYKSAGSIGFMGWMEGMEFASSASEFERRTGIEVDSKEYTIGILQQAIINSKLEKIGYDKVFNAQKAGTAKLLKTLIKSGFETAESAITEGFTEALQQLNGNLAVKVFVDTKQDILQGIASSFMGGLGSGGIVTGVSAAMENIDRVYEQLDSINLKLGERGEIRIKNPKEDMARDINARAKVVGSKQLKDYRLESLSDGSFQRVYPDGRIVPQESKSLDDVIKENLDQTQTPEFKKWFGDSKVVDENGKPLVVYHGSGASFNIFDADKIGQQGTSEGKGFYFTNKKNIAKGYQKTGGNLFEVYLDIQNPLNLIDKNLTKLQLSKFIKSIDPDGQGYLSNWGDVSTQSYQSVLNEAVDAELEGSDNDLDILTGIYNAGNTERTKFYTALKNVLGYDGVIATNPSWGKGQTIYVPFLPTQIKSATGNKGTFDSQNPDIRYRRPTAEELSLGMSEEEMDRLNDEGKAFIAEYLPELIEYVKTPALLLGRNNMKILGDYLNGIIRVRRDQPLFVWKHEAGHAFFDIFLSPQEKRMYIDTIKRAFPKEVKAYMDEYKTDSDYAAEEVLMQLAEKVDSGEYVYKGKRILPQIVLFLRKVIRRIRAFFGSDKAKIQSFYDHFYNKRRSYYNEPSFKTPSKFQPRTTWKNKARTITGDIIRRGYLNQASLEAAGYSLKEYPALRQLTRKDGKLKLDELAEEYAADNVISRHGNQNPTDTLVDYILNPDKNRMPDEIEKVDVSEYEIQKLEDLGFDRQEILDELKAQADKTPFDDDFDPEKLDNEIAKDKARRAKEIMREIEKRFPSILRRNQIKSVIGQKTGIKDTSPTVEMTERELLREKMRTQSQAAKYGYREGWREAKRKLIEKYTDAKQNVEERKRAVIDYINQNAPAGMKRNLLGIVNNVKTDNDALKALMRVEDIVQKYERKQAIKEVLSLFDRADGVKSIAVEYRNLIQSIQDEINFKNRREDTINRIRKTGAWINKQIAEGKDVSMPRRVYEAVRSLEKTSIHELSLPDIYILYDTLETLVNLGETKQASRQAIYTAEKSNIEKQLLATDTQKIESRELESKPIGENLSAKKTAKNLYRTALNKAQAVGLNLTPMDTIFDMFDKGAGYVGAWYTNFKRRIDNHFSNYLTEKWVIQDAAVEMVKKLKLNDNNFERIGIHAAVMQDGGREKLLNNGFTEKEINSVKLNPKELEYYNWMRSELDKMLPQIKDMMANVFNEDVGEVKNYFSFMTDFDAINELEAAQRAFDSEDRKRLQTKPNLSFTHERVGAGKQKIKINAHKVFIAHVDNAIYAINMTQTTRMLNEILESEAIEKKIGLRGKTIIKQWLDLVNRKGGVSGQQQINQLDFIRKNLGMAMLGFKLSSAMKQPIALLNGAELIGHYAFRGAGAIATSSKWRKLVASMPEIRERVGDDPAFQDSSDSKLLKKLQEAGMFTLKKMDAMTAAGIAAGAYMSYIKKAGLPIDFNNPNKEAMAYAQSIVRRSQSTSIFKDVPLAVSRGKYGETQENRSLAKMFLQFQTFMLSQYAIIRHDLPADVLRGRPVAAARKLAFLSGAIATEVMVSNLSKEIITAMFGGDDRDDDDFLEQYIMQALQTIPFVSQAVSAATYGSIPVPLLSAITRGFQNISYLAKAKKPETKRKWMMISGIEATGMIIGLPGMYQLSQILRKKRISKKRKSTFRGF